MVKDTKLLKEKVAAAKRAAGILDQPKTAKTSQEFVESTPLRVSANSSKRKSLSNQLIVERELYTSGENSNDTIYSGSINIHKSSRKEPNKNLSANVIQIDSSNLAVLKELNSNETFNSRESHVTILTTF
jgi:hypothetical protein